MRKVEQYKDEKEIIVPSIAPLYKLQIEKVSPAWARNPKRANVKLNLKSDCCEHRCCIAHCIATTLFNVQDFDDTVNDVGCITL